MIPDLCKRIIFAWVVAAAAFAQQPASGPIVLRETPEVRAIRQLKAAIKDCRRLETKCGRCFGAACRACGGAGVVPSDFESRLVAHRSLCDLYSARPDFPDEAKKDARDAIRRGAITLPRSAPRLLTENIGNGNEGDRIICLATVTAIASVGPEPFAFAQAGEHNIAVPCRGMSIQPGPISLFGELTDRAAQGRRIVQAETGTGSPNTDSIFRRWPSGAKGDGPYQIPLPQLNESERAVFLKVCDVAGNSAEPSAEIKLRDGAFGFLPRRTIWQVAFITQNGDVWSRYKTQYDVPITITGGGIRSELIDTRETALSDELFALRGFPIATPHDGKIITGEVSSTPVLVGGSSTFSGITALVVTAVSDRVLDAVRIEMKNRTMNR